MSFRAVFELKDRLLGPKRTILPGECQHLISISLSFSASAALTVSLMKPPELEVTISFPGMVELVKIRDLGQQGTGIPG